MKRKSVIMPKGTLWIPATTAPFVARDRFVVNTEENAQVKISEIDIEFWRLFLPKIEKSFGGSILKYGKLRKDSVDELIVKELGGKTVAEISLTELFAVMEMQGKVENSPLLTDGHPNVFYIGDKTGQLRSVSILKRLGGWYISALTAVMDPEKTIWFAGDRIFGRSSVLPRVETLAVSEESYKNSFESIAVLLGIESESASGNPIPQPRMVTVQPKNN